MDIKCNKNERIKIRMKLVFGPYISDFGPILYLGKVVVVRIMMHLAIRRGEQDLACDLPKLKI